MSTDNTLVAVDGTSRVLFGKLAQPRLNFFIEIVGVDLNLPFITTSITAESDTDNPRASYSGNL